MTDNYNRAYPHLTDAERDDEGQPVRDTRSDDPWPSYYVFTCPNCDYHTAHNYNLEVINDLEGACPACGGDIDQGCFYVPVTGDWLMVTDTERDHYRAAAIGAFWNGLATPRFTREVAAQVVADQAALVAEFDEVQTLTWEGDNIKVSYPAALGDYDDYVIEPDEAGLYNLSLGWAWTIL